MPGTPQVSEAFELLRQGRDAEARALLEKVVQDDNADAAVLETLGDVREKLGDKAGAIDAYLGAVTHLRVRGELQRALGVLELMLIVDENSIDARLEAAAIREEKGDAVGAWRELAAAANAAGHATRTTDQEARKVEPAVLDMNGPVPNAAAALAVIDALAPRDPAAAARIARALAGSLLSRRLADDARQVEARAAALESARAAESDERSPLARLLEEREDPVPKTDPGAPSFSDDTAEHARDDQSDDDDTTDVER
ncbi:MAG: hypothetical protein HYS27_05995 [Deltaproteobacteria bacterium]|nr:hypothetical protein [Deltaproteobacteria bacterium]